MLPRHDEIGLSRRIVEACSIALAVAAWAVHAARFAASWAEASWWTPAFVIAGMAAADLASGIVHWAADTWGRESMPVIGRRLLHPFRVHHVNPDDLLKRGFLDANGDIAMASLPLLAAMLWISLDGPAGRTGMAFMLGMTGVGMWTNQIHQWAHMPNPSRAVQLLQGARLILGRQAHQKHHDSPHVTDYCIACGWCNGLLNRVGFFRRLEAMITWATGCQPRADEVVFHAAALASRQPL